MRILHFADLHIGMENYGRIDPKTGLHTRLLDFLNVLDSLVDYATSKHVDAVVFAGDAFKSRDPNPTQQREFSKRIRTLAKRGIPVVLVTGNHDTPLALGRATSLEIYPALEIDGVWVSRKVEILTVPTKNGTLQILAIPWLPKEEFTNLGDTLQYLYQKLNPALPTLTVCHADVSGAIYGSERQVSITSRSQIIPLSLLTHPNVAYVALGHIHKHQVLAINPPVIYSGSLERIDFGEEKEPKGFIDLSISREETTWQFITTPARQFITISINLDAQSPDPTRDVLTKIKEHDLTNKIVKIALAIPAALSYECDLDAIRKACGNAFYLASIVRNIERVDRKILIENEKLEQLSPLEAFALYLKSKNTSEHKLAILVGCARKLIEEVPL